MKNIILSEIKVKAGNKEYFWCRVEGNNTVTFGKFEEKYGDSIIYKFRGQPNYWDSVCELLEIYARENQEYYNRIVEVLQNAVD